jgi:hypothetical protein
MRASDNSYQQQKVLISIRRNHFCPMFQLRNRRCFRMDNSRNCRTQEDASLYGRKNVLNMIERETDQLKRAIESQHGGAATMVQSVAAKPSGKASCTSSTSQAIPRSRASLRGHHLSREAKSAGSLPFPIFRLSRRQEMLCGLLWWLSIDRTKPLERRPNVRVF